jgi:predicted AAA+ superfamily ATPase
LRKPYTNTRFSYWRGKKQHEVDIIVETESSRTPFEVKYRSRLGGAQNLKGPAEFMQTGNAEYGCVATRSAGDFGFLDTDNPGACRIMRVPAPLLCCWLGRE